MAETKDCFVISPIGEPGSDTRKRSDQILRHVIKPAVADRGYTAIRADEIDKPGIITSQVIQRVVADPLVVADLTERNPNVFYELAVRHALKKPLVQLIKNGEAIPFDVAGTRTIQVDHHDLDSVENAKREIVTQIDALEKDPDDLETPISVSLDLQLLRQSEKPEERSLADLVSLVAELRSGFTSIESLLSGGEGNDGLKGIRERLERVSYLLDENIHRSFGLLGMRAHGRGHPGLLRHLVHEAPGSNPAIPVLIVAGLFRDTMPWVYQLGVEVYQALRTGDNDATQLFDNFAETIHYLLHNSRIADAFGLGRELQMTADVIDALFSDIRSVPPSAFMRAKPTKRRG